MDLQRYYDSLDVEHKWLPGQPVNCVTGEYQPGQRPITSHCSCFVFAALQGLGVPMLGPPSHSPVMLANAQNAWLKTAPGWRQIRAAQATPYANMGLAVVASIARSRSPGHIALVRPQPDPRAIRVISAGLHNYNDAALGTAFSTPDRVEFFVYTG